MNIHTETKEHVFIEEINEGVQRSNLFFLIRFFFFFFGFIGSSLLRADFL